MTDFEKFIQQFDDHVNQIVDYDGQGFPLMLGIIDELGPIRYYSKISKCHVYEFAEFTTRDVIEKLAKISFIDIQDDPAIQSLALGEVITVHYLGITCNYGFQNSLLIMSDIKVEFNCFIHAAALYECMKQNVQKPKQSGSNRSSKHYDRLNIINNAITVFENWAKMKGIAVEENFYHKQNVKQIQDTNQIPKKYTIRYGDSFLATEDFSEVKHNGKTYIFTDIQSKAIKFIFSEHKNMKNFRVSGYRIVKATDSEQSHLSSIFKGNPGWKKLIIKVGQSRYKLDINIKE